LALRHGEFALTIPAAPQEGKATYFNSLDILDTGDLKTKKNEILGVSNLQQSLKVNHFTAYSRTKISPDDCAEGILRVEEGRQEEGAGEGEGERE